MRRLRRLSTMRSSIHNALSQVASLREALLAPSSENLLSRIPLLEDAARALCGAGASACDAPAITGRALRTLSRELCRAAALIEHGYALQLGWARILAAATAEYRPDGQPARLQPKATVSIEG